MPHPLIRKRFRLNPVQARHALRTTVAALASHLLTVMLGLDQGYWAVISAIIVMQANLGRSLASGWSRLLGTALGALAGALPAWWLGSENTAWALALATPVCAYFLHWHESFRLAGVTAAIVILLAPGAGHPLLFALERVLEITLGVGVAMAVSLWVLPFQARRMLRSGVRRAMLAARDMLDQAVTGCLAGPWNEEAMRAARTEALDALHRDRALLAEAKREPGGLGGLGERGRVLAALLDALDRLGEDCLHVEQAARELSEESLHHKLRPEIEDLHDAMRACLERLAYCIDESRVRRRDLLPEIRALNAALHGLDQGLERLRANRATFDHTLREVSHFFTLLFSLREAALETHAMLAAVHEATAEHEEDA